MKSQKAKELLLKLIWLQGIFFIFIGSMIPVCISIAAGGACSHDYVIQQAKPGSGRTNKICSKCGDTKQITLPTKVTRFTWGRDEYSIESLDYLTFEVGDVIRISAAFKPYEVDNREFIYEISDPSIATMVPVPDGHGGDAAFLITGTGELTVSAYAKYDPSVRFSTVITIPEITDEMVYGKDGKPKDFIGLGVEYHTQEQIRDYYLKYPNYNLETKYKVKPLLKEPYDFGELSEENKQDALNLLNLLRYITGVPTVSISDSSQKAAQAAAVVCAINVKLSHGITPVPEGMKPSMVKLAGKGTGNSNLVAWQDRLGDTLIQYMIDKGNFEDFGHRLQLLKPHYDTGAGFGIAYTDNGLAFSATYVGAYFRKGTLLAYPGQNQPIEYFGEDYGWTVSIPEKVYRSKINVKLTDMKTGKTWDFNKKSQNLTLDSSNFTNVIFFPEDIEYKEGDRYKVEITGIRHPISYEVNMFRLTEGDSIEKANVDYAYYNNWVYDYDGEAKKPKVSSVRLGTYTLKEGSDYTVSYENNINAGTAKLTIAGKGHYRGTITKTFEIKANTFTRGSCRYRLSDKNGVVCLGLAKGKKVDMDISIFRSVEFNGKKFRVTSIAPNAFKGTNITSVYIGPGVKVIGESAFKDCKKLSKIITMGLEVEKICPDAFNGCKKLKNIYLNCIGLKFVGENAFKGINKNAIIRVRPKKLREYKKLLKGKGQGKKVKIVPQGYR